VVLKAIQKNLETAEVVFTGCMFLKHTSEPHYILFKQ